MSTPKKELIKLSADHLFGCSCFCCAEKDTFKVKVGDVFYYGQAKLVVAMLLQDGAEKRICFIDSRMTDGVFDIAYFHCSYSVESQLPGLVALVREGAILNASSEGGFLDRFSKTKEKES